MNEPPGPARTFRKALHSLFAIQFFSWSAMFALWLCAVPFIGGEVLHGALGSPDGMQAALIAVGLCFSGYALLGAIGGLFLPRLVARTGHALAYSGGLAAAATGLLMLSQAHGATQLAAAFFMIGLGWCVIGSLPYAILGKIAPEGQGSRAMRIFAFSPVLPQVVTTLAYAGFGAQRFSSKLDLLLLLAAASMAVAALLALAARPLFAPADLVDEDW